MISPKRSRFLRSCVCAVLTLFLGAGDVGGRPCGKDDAARHAFVSANATAAPNGRRVRVRAVSRIFAFCDSRDRRSLVLQDSDSAFVAALQARFSRGFDPERGITYRRVADHPSRAAADRARQRELADPAFAERLEVPYAWRGRGPCR